MVQIIPENPSFGAQLARGLGAGLSSGVAKSMERAADLKKIQAKEQAKYQGKLDLLRGISPKFASLFSRSGGAEKQDVARELSSSKIPSKDERFLQMAQEIESSGRELSTEDLNNLWQSMPEDEHLGIQRSANPNQGMGREKSQEASGFEDLGDDELAVLSLIEPNLAKTLQAQEKHKRKSFESDRTFHSKRSAKFMDKITEMSEGSRERRAAIDSAIQAVQSGEMKTLGGDFWANTFNLPQLRTQSGAVLSTSAKVNLMGSLGKTGARPNQFIEKQINDAFAKAGQSKEANMAQLEIARTVLDMDEKYADIASRVADQYRQELGYVPENIDSIVEKQMKPYAERRMDKLAYSLQEGREKVQKPDVFRSINKVFPGTPLTKEKYNVFFNKVTGATEEERDEKAIRAAKKAGYKILDENSLAGD